MSQTDVQEKSLPDKGPGVGAPCAGRAIVNNKVAGAVRRSVMWEMCLERVWEDLQECMGHCNILALCSG